MTGRFAGFKLESNSFIGTALIVLGGVVLFFYAERRGVSYRELIVVSSILITGVIVFGRELGIRLGLVLWVLTLALGYRTVELTPNLAIHPSELLLWVLLICTLLQRRLVSDARLSFPVWLWLFIPFWVLAWWPMIGGGGTWDQMLNEFRNFLLLIPLIIVGSVVLQKQRFWSYLLLTLFITGSFIGLMGSLEYWFPAATKFLPAFVSDARPTISEEGFARAQFSFWGGPHATFICVLALPSAIALTRWRKGWSGRVAIATGVILQVLAIYIGGYRSIWLVLLVQVVIACLLGFKKHGVMVALLCFVFAVAGYQFIPIVPKTNERAISAIAALQGHPTDTSAANRKDRALAALSDALESPLGSGWSTAGWVHSDFLQVAANLGIIAGLIFLGGYLFTLLRLAQQVLTNLKTAQGDLGFTLLLSFIGVGGLLAMEGVSVLPQLVLPVWFVWTLAEIWLRRTADQPEFNRTVWFTRPNPLPAAVHLSSFRDRQLNSPTP